MSVVAAVRRFVASRLGVTREGRGQVVESMLGKPADEHARYWLELLLSGGIATFGLVLNSSAVVIGAMLIAPLMTPIVELAMALAILSLYLLLRALWRVALSVVIVVGLAALITALLPFGEPTREILARTSPNVLDLLVATLCAVAAALTTAKPSSGAASTAAGTAIGISLVPPLCAAGFGIGIGARPIADGAMLLFIANFCAIMVFASAFFWLAGFGGRLARPARSQEPLDSTDAVILPVARVIERKLGGYGWWLRLVVPLALLGSVLVPLSRALNQVSWEVQTRAAINRLATTEPLLADAVQFTTTVEPGNVRVRAVIVGRDEDAAALEERVASAVMAVAGLRPLVAVRAVPEAGLASRLPQPNTPTGDSPAEAARVFNDAISTSLGRHWPSTFGERIATRVSGVLGAPPEIQVLHEGAPLGSGVAALLERTLSDDLGSAVRVSTVTVPDRIEATAAEGQRWLGEVAPVVEMVGAWPQLSLCLEVPGPGRARRGERESIQATLDGWLASIPAERRVIAEGEAWRAAVMVGTCAASADSTPAPGQ